MSKKILRKSCVLQSNDLAIHYDIYLDLDARDYKGVVQIAHGMIEHRAKYKAIAEFLAKNGFIVAINDHRGHGDSVNCDLFNFGESAHDSKSNSHESTADSIDSLQNSDKIYLGEMGANGFETALDDMHNLHLALKSRFNGLTSIAPIFAGI